MPLCKQNTVYFLADVCDGIKDCFFADDELYCLLNNSNCPPNCLCLTFAVTCDLTNVSDLSDYFVDEAIVSLSVSGNVFLSELSWLQSLYNIKFLAFINFLLSDICIIIDFQTYLNSLITLHVSDNSIILIRSECFFYCRFIL